MEQSIINSLGSVCSPMRLKGFARLWLVALVALSQGFGQALYASPLHTQPLIITSIRPLALIARQVTGDMITVQELLAASQDPHHAALTVSQRRLLDKADLVVWVGPGLEGYLAKPLASKEATAVMTWSPLQPRSRSVRHSHGHGVDDPHLWLDPDATLVFSRQLVERLAIRYPHQADTFAQQQREFEALLTAKVKILEQRLTTLRQRSFIAEHAAYTPFIERFGLASAGSLTDLSGVAKGAKNLWQLKKQGEIGCVVVERLPGSKMARQLADDLGVQVVEIDPLGLAIPQQQGYLALLEAVARGFEVCLQSGPDRPGSNPQP